MLARILKKYIVAESNSSNVTDVLTGVLTSLSKMVPFPVQFSCNLFVE